MYGLLLLLPISFFSVNPNAHTHTMYIQASEARQRVIRYFSDRIFLESNRTCKCSAAHGMRWRSRIFCCLSEIVLLRSSHLFTIFTQTEPTNDRATKWFVPSMQAAEMFVVFVLFFSFFCLFVRIHIRTHTHTQSARQAANERCGLWYATQPANIGPRLVGR